MRPDVPDGVEDAVLVQEVGKDLRDRSCRGLIGIGEDNLHRNLSGRRSYYGDCETWRNLSNQAQNHGSTREGHFASCLFPRTSAH